MPQPAQNNQPANQGGQNQAQGQQREQTEE
jgi:hypothetical protein